MTVALYIRSSSPFDIFEGSFEGELLEAVVVCAMMGVKWRVCEVSPKRGMEGRVG